MSVVKVFAKTMYMNSSTEELNWGRRSEPQEASCSKRKHDILEPNVGFHRQRSQKKADANVLQNFFHAVSLSYAASIVSWRNHQAVTRLCKTSIRHVEALPSQIRLFKIRHSENYQLRVHPMALKERPAMK